MKSFLKMYVTGIFACCFIIFNTFSVFADPNTSANDQPQYLLMQLAKDSINTDELLIRFSATAKMTYSAYEDAKYMQGYGEVSLYSFSQDGVPVAIDVIPPPKQTTEVIGIYTYAKQDGAYQLNLKTINNIPQDFDIWLMDKYKNDSLDMRKNKTYSFNILKSDPASFGGKRFALVIRQDVSRDYHLADFTATKSSTLQQVEVSWKTANEQTNTNFTIERSVNNGNSYQAIGTMAASGADTYTFTDAKPVTGVNMYRLKQDFNNDSSAYSKTASVFYTVPGNNRASNINVYPNPASDQISLSIISSASTTSLYKIDFMSSTGLIVKEVFSASPQWQGNVNNLQPGVYMIHVLNNNATIGQSKLMKL